MKSINVVTSPNKINCPHKVCSPVLTSTLGGMSFKPEQIPKSNGPTRTVNKGKDIETSYVKISKGSITEYEWKVKGNVIPYESRKTVLPKSSRKVVLQNNIISKPQKMEYDFWINERTLSFFILPKESCKEQSEILAFRKSNAKSKAHAKVPPYNSESKNSKTH